MKLVELIIGAAVLIVIAIFVYRGFSGMIQTSRITRTQNLAATVGAEHLEIIRNLPQENLGIEGLEPGGLIPERTTYERGKTSFDVYSEIENIDHELDGLGVADPNPVDFKKIYVTVSCEACGIEPINFVTQRAILEN